MPYVPCPLCNRRISSLFIERHAASCNPIQGPRPSIKKSKRHPGSLRTVLRVPRLHVGVAKGNPSEIGAPGFHVFPNVFTDLHDRLLAKVNSTAPGWTDYHFRQAKNYGPPYDLCKRRFLFGPDAPISHQLPQFAMNDIVPRLRKLMPLLHRFCPNQLSVNLYQPRPQRHAHILPHNDCENAHISTAVVGVCLGATCTMTLILRKTDSGMAKDVKHDVVLSTGAVYVMSGDSLRIWHHAIFPGATKGTRTSLTFRDVSPRKDEAKQQK